MLAEILRETWHFFPKPIRYKVNRSFEITRKNIFLFLDRLIDRYFRVQTSAVSRYTPDDILLRSLEKNDPYDNVPGSYVSLLRIVRLFSPTPNDIVYDLGCGLGRALFIFSVSKVRKVVGIEFNESIYKLLEINKNTFRGPNEIIDIQNTDALKANLDQATVIYMYNPFGKTTMDELAQRIEESLTRHPRTLKIIYWHPLHLDSLSKIKHFQIDKKFTANTKRVIFASINDGSHP